MLRIDDAKLNSAAEALMIAAISALDREGRHTYVDVPRLPRGVPVYPGSPLLNDRDWGRIRSIALGAVVALVNGAAVPESEANFPREESK